MINTNAKINKRIVSLIHVGINIHAGLTYNYEYVHD